MNDTPKKKNPGGRPPKPTSETVIKCHLSMTQAHHKATAGDRAGIIRRALDWYPGDVDFCIVGKVYSVWYEPNTHRGGYVLTLQFLGGLRLPLYVSSIDTEIRVGGTVKVTIFGDESAVEVLNKKSEVHEIQTKNHCHP